MESVVRNFSARSFAPLAARLSGAVVLISLLSSSAFAKIDADPQKSYQLSGKHGPWMIMVTSLSGDTPDQEKSAKEAADALVYQLRRKGIPAYVYRLEDQYEEFTGIDRSGRDRKRKYKSQNGMIGVVAGNYDNIESKVAQQTLNFVKKFEPKVTVGHGTKKGKTDVTLSLKKAFLARNPLLPPDETARHVRDPLLLKINDGIANSLFENKGKYTLVVSSFYGNSAIKPASFDEFDQKLERNNNISLESAAAESIQLCKAMREQGIDAYVFHERFRSIVCVGSFRTKDDQQIAKLTRMYEAKYKSPNAKGGQEVLVAEAIQVRAPGAGKNSRPLRAWTMDPVPELIDVPKK